MTDRARLSRRFRFNGAILLAATLILSCSREGEGIAVGRQKLFSLEYGSGENQLDFSASMRSGEAFKTRITMREGIFLVSNGSGAKISRFSSFGDILSMIYNPERAEKPSFLSAIDSRAKPESVEIGVGRFAAAYPLSKNGELALDSAQNLYVEDRTEETERVRDPKTADILDRIVLKFDRAGRILGHLGQEGMGGTPFHPITAIHVNEQDDCIVLSASEEEWFAHWFDKRGVLVKSLRIRRDALPLPAGSVDLIASLDDMAPDIKERTLILKIDYYAPLKDKVTGMSIGLEYRSSWLHALRLEDASTAFRIEIPSSGGQGSGLVRNRSAETPPIPAFLGLAGNDIFLMSILSDGTTRISALNRSSRSLIRYDLSIQPEEMRYASFFISREGILCALLCQDYRADVVWWRFDKLLLRSLSAERSLP
jgi:hypothetical protein